MERGLCGADDGKKRALLGIPGNHDWFDGLDGFARVFRARSGPLEEDSGTAAPGAERPSNTSSRGWRHLRWASTWSSGARFRSSAMSQCNARATSRCRSLRGSIFGASIGSFDKSTSNSVASSGIAGTPRPRTRFSCACPIPARLPRAEPATALAMLRALDLDPERDPMLCIAGDTHHYERWQMGPSVHLVAGGGGAFLHGAPMARGKRTSPTAVEFPGPVASRALLSASSLAGRIRRAPGSSRTCRWRFSSPRRSVWVLEAVTSMDAVSLGAAVVGAVVCSLLGGWRKRTFRAVALLAPLVGVLLGLVPMLTRAAFDASISVAALSPSPRAAALLVFGLAIFVGACDLRRLPRGAGSLRT